MTSIYEIAEKCKYQLGGGNYQALTSFVIDAYATVVKQSFYENKQDGISEVDGEFIYTFGKTTPLVPTLDLQTDQYYILIPSSYLRLPHEYGINSVSFMKGASSQFVRVSTGSYGMWENIKAGILGGRQTYYVEASRMYFPKMKTSDVGNILLKIAIGLDNVDIDEPLNISRDLVDQIVNIVVVKFAPKPPTDNKLQ
jgi:hypothetical protein